MTKKSPQDKAHATFSASGAKRWLACPGSIQLSELAPPSVDSVWAEEGTTAHACLEAILTSKTPFTTETELRNEHGNEMLDHVAVAVDWVNREQTDNPGTLLVETKVDASPFTRKGEFGTCDIAIVRLFDELVIADYKHGAGVPVEVEHNEQLIYYLLGLAFKYDFNFERYRVVVIQPRCDHEDGAVREFTLTNHDLGNWVHTFSNGVKDALKKKPVFYSGDHCRWCPAKSICPEISTKALKEAQVDFDPVAPGRGVALKDAKGLSPETISRILIAQPKIEAWLGEVKSIAYTKAKAGIKIPGFKLVPKRGTRQWVNVEKVTKEAKKVFGDLAFDVSLKTPAQLEKQAADAKTWVAKRAALVSSGDTLAPESDSRESVPSIADDFEPVSEPIKKRRK